MDIAITADIHLSDAHKDRLTNLKSMLDDILHNEIHHLIIAGDLFDQDCIGNTDLDKMMGKYKDSDIDIHIIPGNHDAKIKQAQFNSPNIHIYAEPVLEDIGNRNFLFLPYRMNKSMGEVIEESNVAEKIKKGEWVLISHGTYGIYNKSENGGEMGYFPLSNAVLGKYRPYKVILGHIHKPMDETPVYYPGSPYPIDKNEHGQRRYLVFNSITGKITSKYLQNTPIYSKWEVLIIPNGNELTQVKEQITEYLSTEKANYKGANLLDKLLVSIDIIGYTKSLESFEASVTKLLKGSFLVESFEINIDELRQSDDEGLNEIAEKTRNDIMKMEIECSEGIKQAAVLEAFKMIYSKEK